MLIVFITSWMVNVLVLITGDEGLLETMWLVLVLSCSWTSWFSLTGHLTRDQFSFSLCSLDYGKGPKTQSTEFGSSLGWEKELLAKSTSWTSKKSHWDSTFFFFPCDQQMFVCDFFTLEWHEVLEALNGTKFNRKIIKRLAYEASQLLTSSLYCQWFPV
ncbi:hypothetical protein LOK49_LG03G02289 [Camellia lanceoleosa]|uniref:Uncharacterized protein n=1 Tax=Camellia lanceoleosa TaxID=1840588 RepID=A0ACC0IFY7_9ERIC|nr:hypothetical protein LOK49_LG03G02289 [Camellia lanceoleosa]